MSALSPNDPCSFARPDQLVVTALHLDLDVDFDATILKGSVQLSVLRKDDGAQNLLLDTRDIKVHKVTDVDTGQSLKYSLGDPVLSFGSKLEIQLPSSDSKNFTIKIDYQTSPECSALQWLTKEQTAGKRQPYLFSQCQAIHARSMLPCQDTPSVKTTYTAKVSAQKEVTILMSAVRQPCEAHPSDATKLVHNFVQKVAIPSYLIAIVGGDIESRKIGPRSHVWSEKEFVDQAAFEFDETEHMLQTAEELMGPYVWGQYDLLVLPPSFPYGGMENPCLTFVTPTLLAGDRSLADVVAHEISHSWTGNLVTNTTFEHFWLNEGHTKYVERMIVKRLKKSEVFRQFLANEGWRSLQNTVNVFDRLNEGHTMFVERKIAGRLSGSEAMRQFKAMEGWKDLREGIVDVLKNGPYTKLIPSLEGVDPDDAFSIVPYEKGFALLYHLETLLGGPDAFEPFLRAYIKTFASQSIDSNQWKDFLYSFFEGKKDKLDTVDWQTWFYGTGMPPFTPSYDDSLAVPCKQLSDRWSNATDSDLSQFTTEDLKSLSSVQTREFLGLLLLEPPLSVAKMQKMESLYKLNSVKNSEIRFKWIRLGLKAQWTDSIQQGIDMVNEQGRMKFTRPIYRDLYAWEASRQTAIDNFQNHRSEMHSTTATLVAKDLQLMD